MRRYDDETLVAFVDGELDDETTAAVASAIESDPEMAARVRMFGDSAVIVRAAFTGVVDEPVPDRLIQAARGPQASLGDNVVPLRRRGGMTLRHWLALPIAASVAALAIGLGAGYWAGKGPMVRNGAEQAAVGANLVDNLAGYYDLYTVGVGDTGQQQLAFADIQTDEREGLQTWLTRRLDRETRVPDLTSYGYSLRGGRIVISEGRPAGQIIYENPQDKRPIAIYVGSTTKRDAQVTVEQRKDLNVAYWRREGRTYAVFGKTDKTMIRDIATKVDEAGGI